MLYQSGCMKEQHAIWSRGISKKNPHFPLLSRTFFSGQSKTTRWSHFRECIRLWQNSRTRKKAPPLLPRFFAPYALLSPKQDIGDCAILFAALRQAWTSIRCSLTQSVREPDLLKRVFSSICAVWV